MKIHKNMMKVFKSRNYILLSLMLALSIGFLMAILLQFVFISPTFSVYIPASETINLFFLITFTLLSSFSITMAIYMYKRCNTSLIRKGGSGFAGTTIGLVATACTCSFVIAPLILAGGAIAATAVAFITAYIVPLRIISLLLLGISVYFICDNFGKACRVY